MLACCATVLKILSMLTMLYLRAGTIEKLQHSRCYSRRAGEPAGAGASAWARVKQAGHPGRTFTRALPAEAGHLPRPVRRPEVAGRTFTRP